MVDRLPYLHRWPLLVVNVKNAMDVRPRPTLLHLDILNE